MWSRSARQISGVAAAAVLLALPASADDANGPWFGTWTLNVAKSTFDDGSAPYRRATCVIQRWQDGLKSVCDMVRARGGVTHLEWAGRFDGQDYPVQGVEEAITYAYTRLDDRSYDVRVTMNDAPVSRSRVSVSIDGATMTIVTSGRNGQGRPVSTTLVYERVVGSTGSRLIPRTDPAGGPT